MSALLSTGFDDVENAGFAVVTNRSKIVMLALDSCLLVGILHGHDCLHAGVA